ncbi:hypothetical protein N9284_02985 [Halieaceae bacterium]|nr:hypothetical protein [Halieaceae bacterium]
MKPATSIIVLIVVMLVGACASVSSKTSQSKTNAFLKDLAASQIEPAANLRVWLDSWVEYWVQPSNLTEACKVVVTSQDPPEGSTTYWDGRCKDGYAIGLGRAFLDTDQGLSSFIEEYPGGKNTPINHYSAYHDANYTLLGDQYKGGARGMQVYDIPGGLNLIKFYQFIKEDNLTKNSITMATAGDFVMWTKTYPNGATLNFAHGTNEADSRKFAAGYTDNTGKKIGYSVIVYRNGVVEHWDEKGSAPIKTQLPTAFIEELNREYADMSAMFRMAEKTATAAQTKLNIYTRRTCTGDISVDYVDSKLYGQICLGEGDLSPYSEKIAAAISSAEDRRKHGKELAQQNAERLTQQQAVARQNAAKSSTQDDAWAQSFNQSMTEFNKNMSTFRQTMLNNNRSGNAPTWGGSPQRKVLNCFELSNIVTCR